jgi:hypothetical protein
MDGMNPLNRRQLIKGALSIVAAGSIRAQAAESGGRYASSGLIVAPSAQTLVEMDCGKVRGYISRGVWVFRGIPYADPTGVA